MSATTGASLLGGPSGSGVISRADEPAHLLAKERHTAEEQGGENNAYHNLFRKIVGGDRPENDQEQSRNHENDHREDHFDGQLRGHFFHHHQATMSCVFREIVEHIANVEPSRSACVLW